MFRFKLTFLAFVVVAQSFGDIPDRVNYEKFQNLSQSQAKVLEKAKLEVPPLRQTLKEKEAARKTIEGQQANLTAENVKGQQALEARQKEIKTLEGQTAPTAEKIRQNTAKLTQIAADDKTIAPAITAKDGEVQKAVQAVKDSERIKAAAQATVTQTEKSQTETAAKVKGATTERDRLAADLAKQVQDVAKIKAELTEKNKTLTAGEEELKTAIAANGKLTTELQALHQKKEGLVKRKVELEAKPRKTPAEVAELAKITTVDLPPVNAAIQTATQAQRPLVQRIQALNLQLPVLKEQIRVATTVALPKAEQEAAKAQTDLDASNGRLAPLVAIATQLTTLLQTQKAALATATTETQRLVGIQTTVTAELEALRKRQAANAADTVRLTNENRTLQTQLNAQEQQIRVAKDAVKNLEDAAKVRATQMTALNASLVPAKAAELAASQAVTAADARVQDAEAKATAANQHFQSVLAQYNKEKDNAQILGQTNGKTAGSREGTERGQADGKAAGNQLGNPAGLREGERDGRRRDYQAGLKAGSNRGQAEGQTKGTGQGKQDGIDAGTSAGFAEGAIEGEESGRKEGFRKGHDDSFTAENNPHNRKRGYDAGYAAGLAKARGQAANEDYPRGRARVEQDWFNRPPSQKVDIDVNPSPVGPQTRLTSPIESRLAVVLAKLSQWLIPDAIAAALDLGPVPQATPNYQYKQCNQAFDHPDFVQGYKAACEAAYDVGFRNQYGAEYGKSRQAAYEAGYQAGYNSAFAVPHNDETTKGDAEGYHQAFATHYPSAYQTAQSAAYAQSYAQAKTKGVDSVYAKAFADAKALGERAGKIKGFEKAISDGRKFGEAEGYANNLSVEKEKAYEAGRQEATGEFQNYYRPKLLSAILTDAAGGRLTAGRLATLQVVVRNFGAQASPDTSLAIRVRDRLGNFPVTTDNAFLKSLPAGAEATFRNVLVGTPTGNNNGIQLDVELIADGFTVNQLTINQSVDQSFGLNLTEAGQVAITNLTNEEIPAGLRLRLRSRDGFEFHGTSHAIRFPSIPAKQTASAPAETEGAESVFVEAFDGQDRMMYRGYLSAPSRN